jgi:hypothetical protein
VWRAPITTGGAQSILDVKKDIQGMAVDAADVYISVGYLPSYVVKIAK